MAPQSLGERRKVRGHDIADNVGVNPEILVDEYVAEPPDLRNELRRIATHNEIASTSAEAEIGRLSSCTGNTSMSSVRTAPASPPSDRKLA